MIKKINAILIILLIILVSFPSYAEALDINAPSYILVDPKTGQILYEKNATMKWYPASTTKIMTAILAIENGDLDRVVTANSTNIDPGNGGANIGIMDGEQLTIRTLLNALLVKSANETADIIADNISQSRQAFVDLMNKRAAELGCTSTHFVTTNGMHNDEHYTTVSDMSKIACYAMTLKTFRDIVIQQYYQMPETNKHNRVSRNYWGKIYSTNQLPFYPSKLFNEVLGIKTGYTRQAKNNLVSAVRDSNGMELLSVIFGDVSIEGRNVFTSARSLFEYGFKNFSNQKIQTGNELVKNVPIKDAENNMSLSLITEKDLYSIMPNNLTDWHLQKEIKINDSMLVAPINQGRVLGVMEYKQNGTLVGSVNIVASKNINKSIKAVVKDKAIKLADTRVFRYTLISLVTIFLFILLRLTLKKISRTANSKANQN